MKSLKELNTKYKDGHGCAKVFLPIDPEAGLVGLNLFEEDPEQIKDVTVDCCLTIDGCERKCMLAMDYQVPMYCV